MASNSIFCFFCLDFGFWTYFNYMQILENGGFWGYVWTIFEWQAPFGHTEFQEWDLKNKNVALVQTPAAFFTSEMESGCGKPQGM